MLKLAFVPFLTALAVFLSQSAAAQSQALRAVTPQEFYQNIVGQKLKSRHQGIPFTAAFSIDGTVTVKALLITAHGTWHFNEKLELCMAVAQNTRGGAGCGYMLDLGNGKFKSADRDYIWTLEKT